MSEILSRILSFVISSGQMPAPISLLPSSPRRSFFLPAGSVSLRHVFPPKRHQCSVPPNFRASSPSVCPQASLVQRSGRLPSRNPQRKSSPLLHGFLALCFCSAFTVNFDANRTTRFPGCERPHHLSSFISPRVFYFLPPSPRRLRAPAFSCHPPGCSTYALPSPPPGNVFFRSSHMPRAGPSRPPPFLLLIYLFLMKQVFYGVFLFRAPVPACRSGPPLEQGPPSLDVFELISLGVFSRAPMWQTERRGSEPLRVSAPPIPLRVT